MESETQMGVVRKMIKVEELYYSYSKKETWGIILRDYGIILASQSLYL